MKNGTTKSRWPTRMFSLLSAGALATCILGKPVLAQDLQFSWAKGIGGNLYDFGLSVATDSQGNVITVGWFGGTIDFDPGAGTEELTSKGGGDIFISKLDRSGNFVWAKAIGGTSEENAVSMHIDAANSIYITGEFLDTVDFDPGTGTSNLVSTGNGDVYVLKLASDGSFQWVTGFSGTGGKTSGGVAVDGSGNVYAAGGFTGSVDFGGGTVYDAGSTWDAYIVKLDSNGDTTWAKRYVSDEGCIANDIAVDNSGNVITTGEFEGTTDFSPRDDTSINVTSNGDTDIFIAKLASNGEVANVNEIEVIGTTAGEYGESVTVDSDGNIYCVGYFEGSPIIFGHTTLTSNGGGDVFVAKIDNNGGVKWAKNIGGSGTDYGMDIAIDASGNIYTTGSYWVSGDFDPGPNTFTLTSEQYEDVFISKLDNDGDFIWAKSIGGTNAETGRGVHVDSSGNLYLTGDFKETCDFDPSDGDHTLTATGDGSGGNTEDIYVVKLSPPPSSPFAWPLFLPAIYHK
ncbi:MAG: hypothetical protein GY702_18745 [Desulfobulbaceae bacterium]|nr:hypothetical protein [Desulfobulbaceae bacterium]